MSQRRRAPLTLIIAMLILYLLIVMSNVGVLAQTVRVSSGPPPQPKTFAEAMARVRTMLHAP